MPKRSSACWSSAKRSSPASSAGRTSSARSRSATMCRCGRRCTIYRGKTASASERYLFPHALVFFAVDLTPGVALLEDRQRVAAFAVAPEREYQAHDERHAADQNPPEENHHDQQHEEAPLAGPCEMPFPWTPLRAGPPLHCKIDKRTKPRHRSEYTKMAALMVEAGYRCDGKKTERQRPLRLDATVADYRVSVN